MRSSAKMLGIDSGRKDQQLIRQHSNVTFVGHVFCSSEPGRLGKPQVTEALVVIVSSLVSLSGNRVFTTISVLALIILIRLDLWPMSLLLIHGVNAAML